MIVCFSCSSPVSSVAILAEDGTVLFSQARETAQNASGTCLELLRLGLDQTSAVLSQSDLFAADRGPGSFIGARVGVTLAKSFAFSVGASAAGADAFDLIDSASPVAIPSRRSEFFVRIPGQPPYQTSEPPPECIGYGAGLSQQRYPSAAEFSSLMQSLIRMRPEELLPEYWIDPSISIPKRPYAKREDGDG